jgi:hypothetical protein
MTKVKVVDPFQVNHEGTVHGPGEVFDAEPEAVAGWLAAGWVAEAAASPKRAVKKAAPKRG